jgi:hypothetical protein
MFRRPGPDLFPAADVPPLETVPAAPSRRPDLSDAVEHVRAFARRSLTREIVTSSVEGTTLRLLTFANGQVLGWAVEPIAERAARGGQINDPVALGTALEETFARLELPRRRVAWALPAFQAFCRVVDLPGLGGEELRLAVYDEIERALGANGTIDNFVYFQRLSGRIRQRGVFVLALPKATVLPALDALDVANISPGTMDLRPLALARAVGRPNAVLVNLEDGSLDLVVVDGGVPVLLRSLALPVALARDAAQEHLVQEAERSLAYYDDANPDHPLDPDTPLYLTGSLATGIALAERVRAVTRHPIGRLSGLPPYPVDLPVTDFLVNLGLALKQT